MQRYGLLPEIIVPLSLLIPFLYVFVCSFKTKTLYFIRFCYIYECIPSEGKINIYLPHPEINSDERVVLYTSVSFLCQSHCLFLGSTVCPASEPMVQYMKIHIWYTCVIDRVYRKWPRVPKILATYGKVYPIRFM